jgi:ABC-type phosphate/phosphonate transport system substrate-binding protein
MAWNSPLAWLDSKRKLGGKCRAIAMRDTDRDRVSYVVVRKDSGIGSIAGLEGKTVAAGAIGGERSAFACLEKGEADASCMIDLNWAAWTKEGVIGDEFQILAKTEPYDHCVFTVRDDFDRAREKKWLDALYSMTYENPTHQQMMDMEGLKKWEPGRTTGFGALSRAVESLRFFER